MSYQAATKNLASAAKLGNNPVAVFVGGTSGIGQGMAEAFNRHTKGNSHIVLVGRNRVAAEGIIEKMKAAAPEPRTGSYEFVPCNVSLMSDVHKSSAEIFSRHSKVNFLVMTAGFMSTTRDTTPEGLDKKLAVQYYGRWFFINGLLPSLRAARDAGEDAKVFSVYSAGHGGDIDINDLGSKKSTSFSIAAEGSTYNDLMCDVGIRASQSGGGLAHADPGAVRTNLLKSSDSFLIRAANMIVPLFSALTVSQDEAGERLWSGLYRIGPKAGSGEIPGSWRIASKGEDIGLKNYFGKPQYRKAVWEHTLAETKSMEA